MRSLSIAATGMLAQQLNVEVISNNIANMNTVGFKRQRAEFQDLLYQNVERIGAQSSAPWHGGAHRHPDRRGREGGQSFPGGNWPPHHAPRRRPCCRLKASPPGGGYCEGAARTLESPSKLVPAALSAASCEHV